MISIRMNREESKAISELESLSEDLKKSLPDRDQQDDCPAIWVQTKAGLANRYTRAAGINPDDQLVEVHYVKQLSLGVYGMRFQEAIRKYGLKKARKYMSLFQQALRKDEPSQEELDAITQVFENVYDETLTLRKSPVFRNLTPDRFVLDTVTINNNGLIRYTVSGFKRDLGQINFIDPGIKEAKTQYFGFDPKTAYIRKGLFEISIPLLTKGPVKIDKDTLEETVRKSLQSSVNQNQDEIRSGLIDAVELQFLNQDGLEGLLPYFSAWLKQKV